MKTNSTRTEYLHRLLGIARRNRVRVYFLPRFPGLDWDGLYLVDQEMGAGIAIRDDLEPAWRDWILAHELGHHFAKLNGRLFSPFYAHKVDAASQVRWGQPKRLDPDEESANAWAIDALVTREEWEAAERRDPCDLRRVTARLGLPFAAAVAWGRQERSRSQAADVSIRLSSEARTILGRPLSGQGGHQSFFERLARATKGPTLLLSYRDFSLARERAAVVQGGWLIRYQVLLRCVAPLVEDAGGVRELFDIRCLSREGAAPGYGK
jgi:hypothetical protein